jgi:hypothetical protein
MKILHVNASVDPRGGEAMSPTQENVLRRAMILPCVISQSRKFKVALSINPWPTQTVGRNAR